MIFAFWNDITTAMRDPLVLQATLSVAVFIVLLVLFRRIQRAGAELERRKLLKDYVRGLDEYLRGDHNEAIETLHRVLEEDPANIEARIAIGDCYRESGDPAEAKKHHHEVAHVFQSEMPRNYLSLGLDDLALGHHEQAVESFEKASQEEAQRADALAGMAQAYVAAGYPVEAAEALRRLYPEGPAESLNARGRRDAAQRFAEAGRTQLDKDQVEDAVLFFTEALAFDPRNLRARTGIVRAAQQLGDPERAKDLVEKHLASLRDLAADESVLFEPGAAPVPAGGADAVESRATSATVLLAAGDDGADGADATSYLPSVAADVGGVVAAVERKTARYECAECGALLRDYDDHCPACGTLGRIQSMESMRAAYTAPIRDFKGAVDEVEENAAYVQSLAVRVSDGDDAAMQKLQAIGPSSIYEVFAVIGSVANPRLFGERVSALGEVALPELRRCHAERSGSMLGPGRAADDFLASFALAFDQDPQLLGQAGDRALAAVLADSALKPDIRDRAQTRLQTRGIGALAALVDALTAQNDPGALQRGAVVLAQWGPGTGIEIEKSYLESSLFGRLLKDRSGERRRLCADLLAASGLPEAVDVLDRAVAREKDAGLRSYYLRAKERAGAAGGDA